jgi:flagellar basal-body rod protein FlgG
MQNATLVGLSRLAALERQFDVVANNIANLNTAGFKASSPVFQEFLSSDAEENEFSAGDAPVHFVNDPMTIVDWSEGPIQQSGNPLDIAIDGNAFLAVQTTAGERYTRNGALKINAAGTLVTADGTPIAGDNGPIVFQTNDRNVSISADGRVSVVDGAGSVDTLRGKLKLVSFASQQLEQHRQHVDHRLQAPAREFSDLLYEHVRRIGSQASDQGNILPAGIDLGSGVKTVGTPRVMTQGSLSQTGNAFDMAVIGDGFFKIQMPDGTFSYTRDSSFQMDGTGRLVTTQGYVVQPGITVPQNATGFTVNAQGQVSVTPVGSTTPTVLGQLTLTRFLNQAGLLSVGDNLFQETPASGPPQDGLPGTNGAGTVQQASLEQSNVDSVAEISDLIAAQRAYEMNSKVITAANQMLSSVVALQQ